MFDPNPTVIDTDLLIVGGGVGGMSCALRGRELGLDVTVAEKAGIARSGPCIYVHSQTAPWRLSDEEMEAWAREFVEDSNYLADQKWLEIFLKEAPDRIDAFVKLGVPYERHPDGKLLYTATRGHKICKSLNVDGRTMMEILAKEARRRRARLIPKIMVTDLLTSDGKTPTQGRVTGAVGFHVRTGEFFVFRAKAVVVATGIVTPKFHYGFVNHCNGDGHMMCYRAGAELAGMEFANYGAFSYWENKVFTPGQAKIQGLGARFINAKGERFMERYDPKWMELTSLYMLARAIITENFEGRGPCYVDMTHFLPEEHEVLRRVVPTLAKSFDEFGIDPKARPVQSCPFMVIGTPAGGGIRVDTDSGTNIPGLYALGMATCLPVDISGHSGSTPSSFSNVGGYRAADHVASSCAGEAGKPEVHESQVEEFKKRFVKPMARLKQIRPADVHNAIGEAISDTAFALFKNKNRIERVIGELREIEEKLLPRVFAPDMHECVKANEMRNYLQFARLCCHAMLAREESRAEHVRVDFPFRDDIDWLKWVIVKPNGVREPHVQTWSLPIETYPVQPDRREKIPYTFPIPKELQ
jgi:succinate dehydrogenase/fumarate reductase flavoprotein subunit